MSKNTDAKYGPGDFLLLRDKIRWAVVEVREVIPPGVSARQYIKYQPYIREVVSVYRYAVVETSDKFSRVVVESQLRRRRSHKNYRLLEKYSPEIVKTIAGQHKRNWGPALISNWLATCKKPPVCIDPKVIERILEEVYDSDFEILDRDRKYRQAMTPGTVKQRVNHLPGGGGEDGRKY